MNFFRTDIREPQIKFLTNVQGATELVPPVPMRKAMPRWFKDTPLRCPVPHGPHGPAPELPSNIPSGMTTIKACAGVVDLMKLGYMIPLWSDHEITTFPDSHTTQQYQIRASINEAKTGGFRPEHSDKMPLMEGEYKFSPKLDSPWVIITPPGWSTMLLPLPFADEEFKQPWRIVPGIIDTDRYHNFNVLLKWRFEGRYLIEQGTPMCAVVPFKRDTTDLPAVIKNISDEEMRRLKAKGKGGVGSGDRMITMPYQRHRRDTDAQK